MKNTIKLISLVLSLFLISCNSGLDQTKIKDENPDKVGEYFYNIFKNNKQEEFNKWVYDPKNSAYFWLSGIRTRSSKIRLTGILIIFLSRFLNHTN